MLSGRSHTNEWVWDVPQSAEQPPRLFARHRPAALAPRRAFPDSAPVNVELSSKRQMLHLQVCSELLAAKPRTTRLLLHAQMAESIYHSGTGGIQGSPSTV